MLGQWIWVLWSSFWGIWGLLDTEGYLWDTQLFEKSCKHLHDYFLRGCESLQLPHSPAERLYWFYFPELHVWREKTELYSLKRSFHHKLSFLDIEGFRQICCCSPKSAWQECRVKGSWPRSGNTVICLLNGYISKSEGGGAINYLAGTIGANWASP